jgi:hypothetical protein
MGPIVAPQFTHWGQFVNRRQRRGRTSFDSSESCAARRDAIVEAGDRKNTEASARKAIAQIATG